MTSFRCNVPALIGGSCENSKSKDCKLNLAQVAIFFVSCSVITKIQFKWPNNLKQSDILLQRLPLETKNIFLNEKRFSETFC